MHRCGRRCHLRLGCATTLFEVKETQVDHARHFAITRFSSSHLRTAHEGKSISTDDIGEPRLNYAPERAHNAPHHLRKMSLAQKTVVSMRQQGFFPLKPFPSPKFPQAALLSPRMQPPVSADLPPPLTPKSPGLTELTMSPGPSILLKPIAYGKSPKLPSPSPSKGSIKETKRESLKKKITRSAVPSVLLRSLGVLPDFSSASLQPGTNGIGHRARRNCSMRQEEPRTSRRRMLTSLH